jgi:hypothetical protein
MIRRCYGLMTFYVVVLTQTSAIDLVFLSVKDFGP